MKFHRVFVIDGIPADEFYEKNASDIDFFMNEDYELITHDKKITSHSNGKQDIQILDPEDDLPF
ncbi:hypothetical protein RCC89_00845 [Cytophagaceae bacterium ABcell3]|nr:hypothetical protein RCC89_00845 [Cytophagaceae bacterium ABcell3]